ncbi:MAG: P1 family peptidase [Clostridia bacterium]|nr:P1 family peptidase [Clostridia bacterium]
MELTIGRIPHGKKNLITDVPGVTVGHVTVDDKNVHTGVTVVMPSPENPFTHKLTAASFVLNGYGKTLGLVQVDELGTIETPIALTNTLNVGKVHDAIVSYMISRCAEDGIRLTSVNPVVCECNDSGISDIAVRPIGEQEVLQAIHNASVDFEEGSVGAGRGTTCYGMKGGIGSSSRVMNIDGKDYHMGILVQTNYGSASDFRHAVLPQDIAPCDKGSIILIAATDLPLSSRQLRRVLKRASVGMARLGSYIGNGSGEIVIGFTTEPRIEAGSFIRTQVLKEDLMDIPFRAIGECAEEAILKSMLCSGPDQMLSGKRIPCLKEYLKEINNN